MLKTAALIIVCAVGLCIVGYSSWRLERYVNWQFDYKDRVITTKNDDYEDRLENLEFLVVNMQLQLFQLDDKTINTNPFVFPEELWNAPHSTEEIVPEFKGDF